MPLIIIITWFILCALLVWGNWKHHKNKVIEVDANLTLEQYLQKYSYMPTRSFTEDDWQLAMTERWQNLQDEHSTQNIEVDALEWFNGLSPYDRKFLEGCNIHEIILAYTALHHV